MTGRRHSNRIVPGVALAVAIALAAGACGSSATPTPSTPPSASPAPIPEPSFTGGPASVKLTEPAAVAWSGGWCARGPDDAWLAVDIGYPNGAEYFGLVVGQSPYTVSASRKAAGGGTFGGTDVVVAWRHGGKGTRLGPAGLELRLAEDLSGATFTGRLADGTEVGGSLSC